MFDVNKLVRPNIAVLKPYESARSQMKGDDYVFLDANENPLVDPRFSRYPDPMQDKIRVKLAERAGIKKEQVLLGNGSDELIDLIIRTFCEPKTDSIIVCPPTFGMYEVSGQIQDIEVKKIQLKPDYQLDLENILKTPAKIIFLPNPGAPVANLLDPEVLESLLRDFSGLVVIDEAYVDFAESESWVKSLSEFPNLIVLQTFSKYWGLAGARVGMMYASEAIVELVSRLKSPYNVNNLSAEKALEVLVNESQAQKNAAVLIAERSILAQFFTEQNFVKRVCESHTNYLWVELNSAEVVLEIYERLKAKKIIIRKYSDFPEFLRVSVGNSKENNLLMTILS